MSKRGGFSTIGLAFSILILLLVFYSTYHHATNQTIYRMRKGQDFIDSYVNTRNGFERLYSGLNNNKSLNGVINYSDINRRYILETVDEEYEEESLELGLSENSELKETFTIRNQSKVVIDCKVRHHNNEASQGSYSIDLVHKDTGSVLEGVGSSDLRSNSRIEVPKEVLYNQNTGEEKLGEYILLAKSQDISLDILIHFNNLIYRRARLNEGEIERWINIKTKDNKVDIYFEDVEE